jgi:hypothetical protein
MDKEVGKIEKGSEILEARIDLNNWLQLWDDKPLWVFKNP